MARITVNPVFDIRTMQLIGHDGQFEIANIPIKFDRQAQGQGKANVTAANKQADISGTEAQQERSAVLPGIEQQAQNPTGYSPVDVNNMLVAQQQGAGGANAAVTGEGKLAALRTRNAGGFAPALEEAARSKGRTLATGALDVANLNAKLKQEQQQQARQQLLGLYGTDTSNQLKAMGLSDEAIQAELAAGRQGWVQNTDQTIAALSGAGGKTAGGTSFAL